MSFQPYDRNPSGIVFFGTDSTDQVFESNSNFTIDGTTLVATNLAVSNGGTIGSASDADSITIASNGDVTFSQDVSITGDLTVNGTTTTVNSTTVTIDDPIFTLGGDSAPASDDNKDRGIEFNWHNGSVAKVGFFGFDDSTGKFTFIPDATNSSEVFSGTAGTIVADLEGDVTGNADTASAWATARTITLGDELSGNVSIDGSANVTLNASLTAAAITGLTDLGGAPDATNDFIMIYDASATALKKVNRSNFVSGLGAMSSFTVTADSGSDQTIGDGESLDIAGGDGITTAVGATDTVTVTVDLKANGGLVIETGEIAVDLGASAITGTLAIGDGGTGGTTASAARTNLGVAIGSDVQAYDAGLTSIAGLTTAANKMIYTTGSDTYAVTDLSAFGRSLIDDADASAARTTLGVDAAGTDNSTNVTLNAAVTDVLSLSTQEISAVDNGSDAVVGWDDSEGTLTYLSAADARTAIGVDAAGTDNSTDVTLSGSYDYITISGQVITVNQVDLTTDVTGQLPVTNGGTGSSSASGARTNLGVAIGSDVQAYHANLAAIAGMTPSDGNFIVGNGSTFVLENGATVRSSLGLGALAVLDTVGTAEIDNGAVTEAKRTRSVDSSFTNADVISSDINLVAGGAGGISITLPAVAAGKMVIVKKTDSAAGTVTVARGGSATIDGATSKVLYHQYESMTFVSDGTNWFII